MSGVVCENAMSLCYCNEEAITKVSAEQSTLKLTIAFIIPEIDVIILYCTKTHSTFTS